MIITLAHSLAYMIICLSLFFSGTRKFVQFVSFYFKCKFLFFRFDTKVGFFLLMALTAIIDWNLITFALRCVDDAACCCCCTHIKFQISSRLCCLCFVIRSHDYWLYYVMCVYERRIISFWCWCAFECLMEG